MHSIVNIIIWLLGAFGIAMFLSFLMSIAISREIKKRADLRERVLLSSIEEMDRLWWKRKRSLSEMEKARIWGDAMNILMTSDSINVAEQYLNKVQKELGDSGEEFRKHALLILQARFKTKRATPKRFAGTARSKDEKFLTRN